jgi:2-keto-3-deoxy-L-rhamnonate aldolase RhmA
MIEKPDEGLPRPARKSRPQVNVGHKWRVVGPQPAVMQPASFSEAMAGIGFDWLLIDTEHAPIGREALRDMLIAFKGSPTVPIVRLTSNAPDYFKIALDLGAQGVVVPYVQSPEDAKHAVRYCRYPPEGERGVGPFRASNYYQQFDEYVSDANDAILLVVQIESMKAVDHLKDILPIAGIDGVFIGPADLAASMNGHERTSRGNLEEMIDYIGNEARGRGVPYGLPVWTPEEFVGHSRKGATLLALGGDFRFLIEKANEHLNLVKDLLTDQHGKDKT